MSNVVASCEDITSKQKLLFYKEMMDCLKTYAEALHFGKSDKAKVTK